MNIYDFIEQLNLTDNQKQLLAGLPTTSNITIRGTRIGDVTLQSDIETLIKLGLSQPFGDGYELTTLGANVRDILREWEFDYSKSKVKMPEVWDVVFHIQDKNFKLNDYLQKLQLHVYSITNFKLNKLDVPGMVRVYFPHPPSFKDIEIVRKTIEDFVITEGKYYDTNS